MTVSTMMSIGTSSSVVELTVPSKDTLAALPWPTSSSTIAAAGSVPSSSGLARASGFWWPSSASGSLRTSRLWYSWSFQWASRSCCGRTSCWALSYENKPWICHRWGWWKWSLGLGPKRVGEQRHGPRFNLEVTRWRKTREEAMPRGGHVALPGASECGGSEPPGGPKGEEPLRVPMRLRKGQDGATTVIRTLFPECTVCRRKDHLKNNTCELGA